MKNKSKLRLVNAAEIGTAISELEKALWSKIQEPLEDGWSCWLVPSKEGVIIEGYDMEGTEEACHFKTHAWAELYNEMFAIGDMVNKPMVKSFISGLTKMLEDLEESGSVCISDYLKESTGMIDKTTEE